MKQPETIEVPVWRDRGGVIVRREGLERTHPQSEYMYIKNVLGLIPENYGVEGPRTMYDKILCPNCDHIIDLSSRHDKIDDYK